MSNESIVTGRRNVPAQQNDEPRRTSTVSAVHPAVRYHESYVAAVAESKLRLAELIVARDKTAAYLKEIEAGPSAVAEAAYVAVVGDALALVEAAGSPVDVLDHMRAAHQAAQKHGGNRLTVARAKLGAADAAVAQRADLLRQEQEQVKQSRPAALAARADQDRDIRLGRSTGAPFGGD